MTRSLSHVRQLQSHVNLTAFIMPTSGKNRKYISIHSRSQRPHSFWSAPRINDLWAGPTTEVRDSWTSCHSVHAQNQVWQIWLVLVSIYCIYNSIQNQNVVGPGQRSRFLVLTKRSASSGDENSEKKLENIFENWLCPNFFCCPKSQSSPKVFFLEGGRGGGRLPLPARTPMMILSYNITVATKNPHLEDAFLFCYHFKYLTYLLH